MRFLKMLIIAWIATCLAQGRSPSVETLGSAILIAGIVWLFIRKASPSDFRVLSRPTAAMMMIAGLSAVGNRYNALRESGFDPREGLVSANLSLAGLIFFVGLVGTLFVKYPPDGPGAPSITEPEPAPLDAKNVVDGGIDR